MTRRDAAPHPAAARGNDWRAVGARPGPAWPAASPPRVSVVVCLPPDGRSVRRTLASLDRQRYPRDRLDIVVVAAARAAAPRRAAHVRVATLRLEDPCAGPAAAWNLGARAAAHDILVYLEGGLTAAPDLVAAHARWHHAVADALTVGSAAPAAATNASATAAATPSSSATAR